MELLKYHGLGNDYIVIHPDDLNGKDFAITLTGPVTKVCVGEISEEIFG